VVEDLAERPAMGRLTGPDGPLRTLLTLLSGFLLAPALALPSTGAAEDGIHPAQDSVASLVLVLVVDQLGGDILESNRDRLGTDGFRRMLDHGVVYTRAFHRFAPTSTGPGHATLSTGALPPVHGIPSNGWRHLEEAHEVYAAYDARHRVLGHETGKRDGTSPANLQAETLADLLVEATSGRSRIFSLSTKDRAAILFAGNSGTAIWYSRKTASFVSSDFYFDDIPDWLVRYNETRVEPLGDSVWRLAHPLETYEFGTRDDQPWERDYRGLGTTFPHRLAETTDFGSALRFTPLSDELLFGLAENLIQRHGLGRGDTIDMLVLGLSATDYVGHAFGPDSLEAEDNLLRLDANLARFLDLVDETVGLDRTLVALSSDHGIPSAPEWIRQQGGNEVGRVDTPGMLDALRERLRARFHLEADPVLGFNHPFIYLNAKVIDAAGVDIAEVERVAAACIERIEGIQSAYTRTDLLAGRVGGTRIADRVAAGFHASRSGHLVVVQLPGWHLDKWPQFFAVNHGSPHDYDAHVPMIFAGPGLRSASVDRDVGTESFAPSIARYLGLRAPAQATGDPLPEIIRPGRSYNPAH
jgi:arylsulfatase A-like enzyme